MTVVALFSDKGSPGVTTLAFALVTTWPRECVLVELDPAGGDLDLRLTDRAGHPVLAAEPGLLSLAAAARRAPTSLRAHAQRTPCGALVVPGLAGAWQAHGMTGLWPQVAGAVETEAVGDVIADLGRLAPDGPLAAVAASADVLVGVTRAEPVAMLRLRDRIRNLHEHLTLNQNSRTLVVLVADDRRGGAACEAMRRVLLDGGVGATVAGLVAFDPRAVIALHLGEAPQRSMLMRSVQGLVPELTGGPAVGSAPGVRLSRRLLVWSR
ncbi:MAG TPA: hypothetical protein VHV82_08355 [Sporichthyaceae bacterium]|jgi:hypothetical protein|nr:hypothetical protein [Sporichthyaceae bacterium]